MKRRTLLCLLLAGAWLSAKATVTFTVLSPACNNNGSLQATSTLPGALTYQFWLPNAWTPITNTTGILTNWGGGPVNVNVYSSSPQASDYGSYAGSPPFTYTKTVTNAVCPSLGSASLSISGGVAPYTVQWIENNSNAVVATGSPASLPGGLYRVKITAANGCVYGTEQNGDTTYIQNISPVSFSLSPTTANCTNGTITSTAPTGTAPFTYLWSNGATTPNLANLSMGGYSLTVTDANGCTGDRYTYVQQSVNIAVNTTPTPATCLQTNGAVIAFGSGGVPPYTYQWSNAQTTQGISGLSGSQYYSVTVKDANGCTGTGGSYLTSSTPVNVTVYSSPSSCTGATGTATASATGGVPPYTYHWSTFPVQTTATATNLAPGLYSFTITDANGCIRTGTANVPPVNVLSASLSGASTPCNASTGTASATVSGGTAPYTYSWSNGGTTPSISGLAAGGYSVTITDNAGCSVTKYRQVATTTPISLGFASTQASCIYANDGTAAVVATGGTAPYTYSWSNGGTTASVSGLGQGYYGVYVTDAAGCHAGSSVTVGYNPGGGSCYCTITGKVFNDANNNCLLDAGEAGIPNIMVHASGFGYAYTNAAGVYSFRVPSGTYTMSESVQAYYPLASCQSNAVPVTVAAASGCSTTVNFANTTAVIRDVSIQTTNSYGPPVPGNAYNQLVVISNNGTVTEPAAKAGYHHDGQLGSAVFTPAHFSGNGPNQYNSNTLFPSLLAGSWQSYLVHYTVPTNIPINTAVQVNDSVAYAAPISSNWLNDYSPWNNVNAYTSIVVSSFDPNYKEVSPRGTGAQGYIKTSDSTLTYTLHFQNTGNWPAQKVVLVDTLDPHLNIASLKPGYSGHSYTATVSEGGVLTFTFNNINLPDSASDPVRSQGLVMYTVKLKPNLAAGTQIRNNADIYFDYNAAVRTNTTLNTIEQSSQSVGSTRSGSYALQVFPNPTSGQVNIRVDAVGGAGRATVSFRNLLGQPVLQQEVSLSNGTNLFVADLGALANGVYFVEVKGAGHSAVTKLNVVR